MNDELKRLLKKEQLRVEMMREELIKDMDKMSVYQKENERLKEKVKQLETNRDEAIEYLKYALDEEKETPSKHNDWRLDLLEIIGRSVSNE